mgnify:FL=1
MPISNSDIAGAFDEMADLLEIQAANPFRVRAYRNAARVVRSWPSDLAELVRMGKELPKLPGLGKDLTGKAHEFAETGRLRALEEIKRETPEGLRDLLRLPGLGPKRVRSLQEKIGIRNLNELRAAFNAGKFSGLKGFGPKLTSKIRAAATKEEPEHPRLPLASADRIAASLLAYLRECKGVIKAEVAGSLRCRRDTVGDLDLLVAARPGSEAMAGFLKNEDIVSVSASGSTRATVFLRSGIQVDLRVVPPGSFGAALHYFTGSKAHNIEIRRLGRKRGLKINEYGAYQIGRAHV